MVLIIAILNDGTILTISKDRVVPSPLPDSWKLEEIFATGVVIGTYLALMTVLFFWAADKTDFFSNAFGVSSIRGSNSRLTAAVYLQVSIISQALIFVTRSRGFCFMERPGVLLMLAFCVAQAIATIIAVYATWGFATIRGTGWGWAGVIWLYSLVTFIPLDFIKFGIFYILSGRAWSLMLNSKTAFTQQQDFGKGNREAQWAHAQRTLHGLHDAGAGSKSSPIRSQDSNIPEIAALAKRRAEIAKLRELHTLKGHVESVVKMKGLDMEHIQQSYTV